MREPRFRGWGENPIDRSMAMNVLEGYGAALFRLSQTVDPVVLIWTSTFALALAYFFIAKLVEPLFPTQQNTR